MREKIVSIFIGVLFIFLLGGLFNLNGCQGKKFKELSDKNCIRVLPSLGSRGNIIDRAGNVIVDNKLSYDVLILPQSKNKVGPALTEVSGFLGAEFKDLKKAFKNGYISSSVPVTVAKNIGIKKAIALEEVKSEIPGLLIQPNPLRHYPYKGLAAHLIGYVGAIDRWRLTALEDYGYNTKDIVGFGGVEEKYDYYLRQEEGGSSFEVDHKGSFTRLLGFRSPSNGRDIQLTIDLEVQKIAQDKLEDRAGAVVILNPYTGEIIALASAPGFNPAVFTDKDNPADISGLFNDPRSPLIDRAISASYAPGSVFKVVVAAGALETKKINLSTSFLCKGKVLIGKREFNCWSTHGSEDLIAALTHSCDTFFYKTGLLLGPQAIHDYALKFGLAKVSLSDLSYESAGFIPSPLWRRINKFKSWFDGDTANFSIGQGDVLTTPLQMARMMSVFANKGYLVNPYVIKAIGGNDVARSQKKINNLFLKVSTIESIRAGLRGVVADSTGTANVLSNLPVTVAGKTGTAQAPPGLSHAWFCGFFPFSEPEFVICVLLEHGGPGHAACVVAKEIIEEMCNKGLVESVKLKI